ncbi:MAG: NADH-quinone oxidoreductase subunit NuoG [Acidiferrobacterales bacterium]
MSTKPEVKTAVSPPDSVTVEINGQPLQAKKGSMVIQVADDAGIYIPRFCYHHKLSVAANCRMCLVEIEKAPKPLPACATPVADGMKVFTRSGLARDAQKGVMEFLLINHPLDCPICDQGGECPLQDLALGYGKDVSRYTERKRVVHDQNIGPLIATEMTRCIHCTRCVRFGQEIAGIMELGATGRGEHMEIGTFMEKSVDSELSGNVIDLCPVGALTSKPFRFTARAWELLQRSGVSPHDCVGTNLTVEVRSNRVMRVLPRVNEAINECWLSDRDRYSYEALNREDRLKTPLIRLNDRWIGVDWDTAFDFTAKRLTGIIDQYGSGQLGALAAPTATLEEFYLLQKLMRSLGSGNIDHRLRQLDFSDDACMPPFPWLGGSIEELEQFEAVLLVGSNIRKEQPLLGHRLRKAARAGAQIMAINPIDYDFAFTLTSKIVTHPGHMCTALAQVAKALAMRAGVPMPPGFNTLAPDAAAERIAAALTAEERTAVLLGNLAAYHPQAAQLRALADYLAELASASLGQLPEANSVGGWIAGCVPHRGTAGTVALGGQNVLAMIAKPLKAYLLFDIEPEFDSLNGQRTCEAMATAEFVAILTPFKPASATSGALEYADVLLPLAPFTETEGAFVNCEGRAQSFDAAVRPLGEARPGWKILRMLGHLLGQPGFTYESVANVRAEIDWTSITPTGRLLERSLPEQFDRVAPDLTRIVEVPMYTVDGLVRRAPSLQATTDNPGAAAHMSAPQIAKLGLDGVQKVRVQVGEGVATLDLVVDARVPDRCVLIPAGYPETALLDAAGAVKVNRVESV